jgi:hypothetical protein
LWIDDLDVHFRDGSIPKMEFLVRFLGSITVLLIFLALFILSTGCLLTTVQRQDAPAALRGELRKSLSMLPEAYPKIRKKFKNMDPIQITDHLSA